MIISQVPEADHTPPPTQPLATVLIQGCFLLTESRKQSYCTSTCAYCTDRLWNGWWNYIRLRCLQSTNKTYVAYLAVFWQKMWATCKWRAKKWIKQQQDWFDKLPLESCNCPPLWRSLLSGWRGNICFQWTTPLKLKLTLIVLLDIHCATVLYLISHTGHNILSKLTSVNLTGAQSLLTETK